MRTFADAYPQYPIVQVPLAQITWYHQIYHRAFVVFLQEQCKSRIRYAGARQTIDNVFSEGELVKDVVVAKFATTTLHGAIKGKTQTQNVEYYNLDVIIPVGYRVKSKQDTQFRIWATNVLRDYLLKGYALNQRINRIENQVENLSEKVNAISLQIQSGGIPNQGVFFDGQVFDAYELASKIIRSTLKSIVLIDNYLEEFH